MKYRITLVMVLIIFAPAVFAGTNWSIESLNKIKSEVPDGVDNVDPYMTAFMTHSFGDSKFGVYSWWMTGKYWGEAYAGPTFMILEKTMIGAAIGFITGYEPPLRYGGMLYSWSDLGYIFGFYEVTQDDMENYWHRLVVNYTVNPILGVGVMTEGFYGQGLRAEINIPKTPIQLWGSVLYHFEDEQVNGLVTAKLNF